MRLCIGGVYDIEYIPPEDDDSGHNEFGLVDYSGERISPKVIIYFYDDINKKEPGYKWKLPLYEWDTDKFYLDNIYHYLLERMEDK